MVAFIPASALLISIMISLRKSLDTIETSGAELTKMMEASVTPELGQNIDISI